MTNKPDGSIVLAVLLGGFLLFVLLLLAVLRLREFRDMLEYINMEIRRSHGKEREYWKAQKRRLWLSLLPFYRG